MHERSVTCSVCGQHRKLVDATPSGLVRPAIVELIRKEKPDWVMGGYVCHADLDRLRASFVLAALEQERGELSQLDREIVDSLAQHELVARNLNWDGDATLTVGQRIADRIASFGGSWPFMGVFGVCLVAWMGLNTVVLARGAFDPYPYILLNLILSCLASVQAPIIMMSQNRQESRDRLRAEQDYRVNLKAELEIRHLGSRLDMLLTHQWERLLEIQQVQTDLLEELRRPGHQHGA
jgi:uncharacterized membrane protein